MPKDIIDLPLQGRMASVRAGTVDEAARTVEIIWTTGATVRRARFWDEAVDEELCWRDQPSGWTVSMEARRF